MAEHAAHYWFHYFPAKTKKAKRAESRETAHTRDAKTRVKCSMDGSRGFEMEKLVGWWCLLIGVTDKGAIHVAAGIVAAFLLMAIPLLIIGLLRYRR